mgnify:FL=1
MKLYHGSTEDITKIDLSKSKPNKDFGRGFYLSAEKEQAEKLAEYKAFQFGGEPTLNVFEFDERKLSDNSLKVLKFDGYSKEWADFVFANRNSKTGDSVHNYDIVVGPIANDRVGVQVRRYIEHEISLETFLENLKYMKGVTFQYFFGTETAINLLRKI